jgi:dTDP-4-dehydrorhamnose reductase
VSQRILLTGANGLLGQKIVKQTLGDNDVEMIATGRGDCRLPWSDFQYATMDITDRGSVLSIFEAHRPDVVIHGAAMTHVDKCELDHAACDLNNVEATAHIIEACEKFSCHLIFISTDFIFDGEAGPYDEEADPAPVNYYGMSKLQAEKMVMKSTIPWAILRTVLVYGSSYNPSRSNIVSWVRENLGAGESLNIVDDQYRSPTWSNDLASGCLLAAKKNAIGIYHISGLDQMSILELTKRVARYYKLNEDLIKPIDSESLGQPAKRPPVTGFKLDKAIRELGYSPHSFEETLKLMDEGA